MEKVKVGFAEPMRVCNLQMTNKVLGQDLWAPEIANTLRGIADMIDEGVASWNSVEGFVSEQKTEVFITCGTYLGEMIPHKLSDLPFQQEE